MFFSVSFYFLICLLPAIITSFLRHIHRTTGILSCPGHLLRYMISQFPSLFSSQYMSYNWKRSKAHFSPNNHLELSSTSMVHYWDPAIVKKQSPFVHHFSGTDRDPRYSYYLLKIPTLDNSVRTFELSQVKHKTIMVVGGVERHWAYLVMSLPWT